MDLRLDRATMPGISNSKAMTRTSVKPPSTNVAGLILRKSILVGGFNESFGTMGMLLNLVPVVSILFSFTTSVGAALWAADIENGSKPQDNVRQPVVEVVMPVEGKKEL
jgi:hypothetical protein